MRTCPQCTTDNDADAHFCRACGDPLMICCHQCGQPNQPRNRHCHACGHGLVRWASIAPAPALTTRRPRRPMSMAPSPRTVVQTSDITVFVSELCGHTAMRDILNPEEVQAIMSLVSRTAEQVVVKNEGLMAPSVGNTIVAVFGARRNNKDDPIRAIRAARAAGRAEKFFRTTIALAGEIGARGIQGQAHYDLGRLQAHRKRLVSARRHLDRSAELFQACGADPFLAQARRQLQSLPGRSNG